MSKEYLYNDIERIGYSTTKRAKPILYTIDSNGCHNVTSPKPDTNGYARITRNLGGVNKRFGLHRVSYINEYGEIPEGMYVMHKCDNPTCINAKHLTIGSPRDNMQDKVNKGRQLKGTATTFSKLTEKDVLAIRKDHRTLKEISGDYGVSFQSIHYIKKRKHWKHLEEAIK